MKKVQTFDEIDIRPTPKDVARALAHECFCQTYRLSVSMGLRVPRAGIERKLSNVARASRYGGVLTRMVRQEPEFQAALFLCH